MYIEGVSVASDQGVYHQASAHGKARRMPRPELAWTGGKASLREPAAVQLQQRPLRRLELCSGEAGHLLVGSGRDLIFEGALRWTAWRLQGPGLRSRV